MSGRIFMQYVYIHTTTLNGSVDKAMHVLIIMTGSLLYICFFSLDTYQILEESEYGTIRFHIPYHFQSRVQSATSSAQNAARSRRLAQEVATLSTSLPLSPSSSVFVRCDEERLDVMKVLGQCHVATCIILAY